MSITASYRTNTDSYQERNNCIYYVVFIVCDHNHLMKEEKACICAC